jgi:hypothetical protein
VSAAKSHDFRKTTLPTTSHLSKHRTQELVRKPSPLSHETPHTSGIHDLRRVGGQVGPAAVKEAKVGTIL